MVKDAKYDEALAVINAAGAASTSLLQRKLRMGYGRAARLLDQLEEAGEIGPGRGSLPREIFGASLNKPLSQDLLAPGEIARPGGTYYTTPEGTLKEIKKASPVSSISSPYRETALGDRFMTPEIMAFEGKLFAGGKKSARMLLLPDWHIPQHDARATELVFNFAEYERDRGAGFDAWGQIGDLMNFHSLSKHNEFDKLSVEGARLNDDFDVANNLLDRLQTIIPGPSFVLEGNHDHRLVKFLEANPLLIGSGLTVPEKLNFEKRGVTWVENWEKGHVMRIGHATFVHGSVTGQYHAAAMMRKFQTNVFYGHTHDEQSYMCVTAAESKARVAHSIGCLEDPNAFWMPYNGNRWQLAFADFSFFADGGFSYSVHKICDYRTAIGGKIFMDKGVY